MSVQSKGSAQKKVTPGHPLNARRSGANVNDNRHAAQDNRRGADKNRREADNNRREARGTAATIDTIKRQGYSLVSFNGKEAVFRRPKLRAYIGAGVLLALAGIYLSCGDLGAHLVGIAFLLGGFYQGGKPAEVFSIDFELSRKDNDGF